MDVRVLHAEGKACYWKAKDLPAAKAKLEEGIALARSVGDAAEEKAMNYDLASFCWPGWDEPGIEIAEDDLAAGEKAADENLRLAEELKRDHGPMANAHFMVGAYQLARGRSTEAQASFRRQREHASAAEDRAGVLLAEGYLSLASRGTAEEAAGALRNSGLENGIFFADQLDTAARVFRP